MKEHVSAGGLSSFRKLPGIVIAATFTVGQRDGVTQLLSSLLTSIFVSFQPVLMRMACGRGRGVCEFIIHVIM